MSEFHLPLCVIGFGFTPSWLTLSLWFTQHAWKLKKNCERDFAGKKIKGISLDYIEIHKQAAATKTVMICHQCLLMVDQRARGVAADVYARTQRVCRYRNRTILRFFFNFFFETHKKYYLWFFVGSVTRGCFSFSLVLFKINQFICVHVATKYVKSNGSEMGEERESKSDSISAAIGWMDRWMESDQGGMNNEYRY